MTELSAVGAAFSAGAGVVCAATPVLNVKTPASTAIVIHDPFACDIAVSPFLDSLRMNLDRDHCEAAGGCKSEIDQNGGVISVFAGRL